MKDTSNQINIEIFEFDFDMPYGQESFKKIEDKMAEVTKKDVSILVNNFGKMYKGEFENMDNRDIFEMLNANINSLTYMTRFVLKNMKD